ncbi:MAG: hypothetical protein A3B13_03140 [Candidatus Liptonbacteria bacterium RIFCSPLOWO2_01_FULL_45_15]|uniref:Uncharacterized protein n=1 Tax=Candidatus Liptonbacteria bacterium RIFCSPLOWO2_01_FULL_45_15 TaxID=1798649 RepID=A0A1G2CBP0_9BACT|nr:MAG: hypothetical protein A3B13_03140 [Candidatus Liptonbacteria bacterium RIFCSPLOWO2_01_FULL_45_15]
MTLVVATTNWFFVKEEIWTFIKVLQLDFQVHQFPPGKIHARNLFKYYIFFLINHLVFNFMKSDFLRKSDFKYVVFVVARNDVGFTFSFVSDRM